MTTTQQQANIEAVKGTVVKVRKATPMGEPVSETWSTKTARIVNYHSPLVWELSQSIYGSEYHHDSHVRTLDGRRLSELV